MWGKLEPNCCKGEVVHSFARPSASPVVENVSLSRPKEMLATGPAATTVARPICSPVAASQRCTVPAQEPVTWV